jgi:aspartate racemase
LYKTIGILGGMGPFATLDVFQKIVLNTPAQTDQDHLPIIIYNNPKIPPRIYNANSTFSNPLPELIQSARMLEQAGADFIIMPCHTAHIWIDKIKEAITIPFYSLVENTVQATLSEYGNCDNKTILLLATKSTIHAQLYQQAFAHSSFELIIPTEQEQQIIDAAIQSVKGGTIQLNREISELNQLINVYYKNGVAMLVGCCTEIPLMFPYLQTEMELIDPTLMLAKMAINQMI